MISLILCFIFVAVSVNASALRGTEMDTSDHSIEIWSGDKLMFQAKPDLKQALSDEKSVTGPGAIIQIGKKAWDFVKNNKAVVDYDDDWAGAVPQTYQDDWRNLQGWKDVKSDTYRFHYKIAGDTVSELKWRYAWSAEGRDANGIGRYVINGGARIEKLYAKVGQTLTAKVSSNEPVNMGTVEDPIGAIDIEVSFTSASVWNSATTTCTVKIMGNSKYDELSCKGNDP